MCHFSAKFWHYLWKFVTCSVSRDKALLCYIVALLHTTSSKFWCLSRLLFVTKYYQQHFSQHPRQAKCTAVPLQIVELSHSHTAWLLVDTKSKIPLLNHQNRIETTVSTHTRKRQHKRLRIASVSSNIFEATSVRRGRPLCHGHPLRP